MFFIFVHTYFEASLFSSKTKNREVVVLIIGDGTVAISQVLVMILEIHFFRCCVFHEFL